MTKKFCPKRKVYFAAYGDSYCWCKGRIKYWNREHAKWKELVGSIYPPAQLQRHLISSWKEFSKDNTPEGVQMPCPW